MAIFANDLTEPAKLVIQWRHIELIYRTNSVDVQECWFFSLQVPCMGKHDPLEIPCDRLKDVPSIYFPGRGLGDKLLEGRFRFKNPDPLLGITESTSSDVDEDKWTKLESLVNSRFDSRYRLAWMCIFFS